MSVRHIFGTIENQFDICLEDDARVGSRLVVFLTA